VWSVGLCSHHDACPRTGGHGGAQGSTSAEATARNGVSFGKTAETVAQYMKKGRIILVGGSLRNRSWEKDGQKHMRTEGSAEKIPFGPQPGKEAPEPVTEFVADPAEAASAEPTVVM
jgi:single-stranded DNA-binding protein